MLVNGHSCTFNPTLVALDKSLAPMTSVTSSKAVVDILEAISGFAMPPLSFLQLVLLSKVIKVSQNLMVAKKIVHEGYSAQTSIRYGEQHVQDTFIAK